MHRTGFEFVFEIPDNRSVLSEKEYRVTALSPVRNELYLGLGPAPEILYPAQKFGTSHTPVSDILVRSARSSTSS